MTSITKILFNCSYEGSMSILNEMYNILERLKILLNIRKNLNLQEILKFSHTSDFTDEENSFLQDILRIHFVDVAYDKSFFINSKKMLDDAFDEIEFDYFGDPDKPMFNSLIIELEPMPTNRYYRGFGNKRDSIGRMYMPYAFNYSTVLFVSNSDEYYYSILKDPFFQIFDTVLVANLGRTELIQKHFENNYGYCFILSAPSNKSDILHQLAYRDESIAKIYFEESDKIKDLSSWLSKYLVRFWQKELSQF